MPRRYFAHSMRARRNARPSAMTLIELIIVVAVVAILASIAAVNYSRAIDRSLKSAGAADLHTIATALQAYYVDHADLPPADREAGPFMSHTKDFRDVGNGPAAGGSWDGLPWMLLELGYVGDWRTMFSPKYLRLYRGGATIRGGHPRYHNFRYAYNSSALSSGGHLGGAGNIMSGTVWMVRDLWLPAEKGFYGGDVPRYPADFQFPWGEGDEKDALEHVLYSDFAVQTVRGGE